MFCEVHHPVMRTVAGEKKKEERKKKKITPHSTLPEIMRHDGFQIAGALKKKQQPLFLTVSGLLASHGAAPVSLVCPRRMRNFSNKIHFHMVCSFEAFRHGCTHMRAHTRI